MLATLNQTTSVEVRYKSNEIDTLSVIDFWNELESSEDQSHFLSLIHSFTFVDNENLDKLFNKVVSNLTTEQVVEFFEHLNNYLVNEDSTDLAAAITVLEFYDYSLEELEKSFRHTTYKDIVECICSSWIETTEKVVELLGGNIEDQFISYFVQWFDKPDRFYKFLYYFTGGQEFFTIELYKYDYREGMALIHVV